MFNWYAKANVCYAYLADVPRHTRIDTGEESQTGTVQKA